MAELAEFDGLFIRATTSIDDYTYRFARRALQEGMPVIDDPVSMIRCTNKVYLHELMEAQGVPIPPTVMLAEDEDLAKAAQTLGWPMVVKIPDGSFSRGVHKVENAEQLQKLTEELFDDTDLLLAQKFMPTDFDWRVGVLDGEPLFVCQYQMARGHWQIIKHGPDGAREGGFRTLAIADAPPKVIDVALRAARAIGARPLRRRHQGDRRFDRGDRGQRQSQSRTWRRGSGRQGRSLEPHPAMVHQAHRRLSAATIHVDWPAPLLVSSTPVQATRRMSRCISLCPIARNSSKRSMR